MHALLTEADAARGWILDLLEALVRAESPTTDKRAVDACGALLAARLREIGGRVELIPQIEAGNHVRADFGEGARGRILILGHFDTVWPVGQIRTMPFEEREARLHGPGIYDMKGGIAVSLLAIRLLGLRPPAVTMLWTSDEETGSATSRGLIEETARGRRAVLVLEPSLPGGAAKTRRKGCGEFQLAVTGKAAHAGIEPERGVNAIHELAHQIAAIHRLQDTARGVSVNVTIVSGGTRTNVIPDSARASIDVRVPSLADAGRIESALALLRPVLPGSALELTGGFGRPPLERTEGVATLYAAARDVSAELGRALGEGGTGGGSDGNFTAAIGVPTLDGLGPDGAGAHAAHEHVVAADLTWRAAFLAGLVRRLDTEE
ncbi:MAG TPA: M20 family metallopeptidase [Vicinamibacterales bacterium]|nr:M20 family metallopeptidase [Vicinamibacterales bacterium]